MADQTTSGRHAMASLKRLRVDTIDLYYKHRVDPKAHRRNRKLCEEPRSAVSSRRNCQRKGCTHGQLALAWLLAQGQDSLPIPGTKRGKYLEENAAAVIKLSPEDLRCIEEAAAGQRGQRLTLAARIRGVNIGE